MTIFQIIAILFAIWMLYVTRINTQKLGSTTGEKIFWYTIWIVFIIIALFPQSLKGISEQLQFARVFDLLLVLALMILSIISFHTHFQQRELKKKIETLVRDRALENVTKGKNAKSK